MVLLKYITEQWKYFMMCYLNHSVSQWSRLFLHTISHWFVVSVGASMLQLHKYLICITWQERRKLIFIHQHRTKWIIFKFLYHGDFFSSMNQKEGNINKMVKRWKRFLVWWDAKLIFHVAAESHTKCLIYDICLVT